MTTVVIDHIQIDEKGNAKIKDSRVKVIQLVMEKNTNNWSMEELCEQFCHLSPASIYAAFAYYYDHKEELDSKIKESKKIAQELYEKNINSPTMKKLRAAKESANES